MFAAPRALVKLARLPSRERGVLLEAALLVPLVHALQSTLPFRRWRALLTVRAVAGMGAGPSPTTTTSTSSTATATATSRLTPEQVAMAIERARKWMPGVYKCLPQAYAGHLLLHRHGYPSVVQVGVSRDAKGGVEAHAWVELDGKVLIGELPDLARFVPLPGLRV